LIELHRQPALFPGGVRNNQLEEGLLPVTSLTDELVVGAARQSEQPDAAVGIAPVGRPVPLDRLRDPVLLGPPLEGLALVEGLADFAVQLVHVDLVQAVLELGVFG
jgi:hypothetical protein